jgi:hypothetical protein
MPRKVIGDKAEKVISSTISEENFRILQGYARDLYIEGRLAQPTISHIVRALVDDFINQRMQKERKRFNPFQHSPDNLIRGPPEADYPY